MSTTRWIATYDETIGRLDIYSSNSARPVYTWRRRRDHMHATQTLILWSWEHPTDGWRTSLFWERQGETGLLVADAWPIRITVEDRWAA
ncbi:hypothetical protein [Streptomyces sp. NPDC048644]|uniref:hypothetical protein n=1 Tax=Streptomyces sp. NPDC048644 TaxID=3365582 RepID=UPI003719475E